MDHGTKCGIFTMITVLGVVFIICVTVYNYSEGNNKLELSKAEFNFNDQVRYYDCKKLK